MYTVLFQAIQLRTSTCTNGYHYEHIQSSSQPSIQLQKSLPHSSSDTYILYNQVRYLMLNRLLLVQFYSILTTAKSVK